MSLQADQNPLCGYCFQLVYCNKVTSCNLVPVFKVITPSIQWSVPFDGKIVWISESLVRFKPQLTMRRFKHLKPLIPQSNKHLISL